MSIELMPNDARLGLQGVAELVEADGWWTPLRLPQSSLPLLDPDLEIRVRMPAGGRFEFVTDATRIELPVLVDAPPIGSQTVAPFDVLVDGRLVFRETIVGVGTIVIGRLTGTSAVEIWMPHYGLPRLGQLRVDGDDIAAVKLNLPRWIAYGSSITQCRLSDGPSETWPALVARANGWNLHCLGMSGECHLDPSMARYIRDTPADIIDICIGINIYNAATFNSRSLGPAVIGFLQTIRDGHPHTPLVVTTTIVSPSRETIPNSVGLTLQDIRSIVRDAALILQDPQIILIDGTDLIGADDADLLADGLHPTDAGYRVLAERIAPRLRAVEAAAR